MTNNPQTPDLTITPIIAKAKISNIAKNVAECYSYHCNIDVCLFVTVMSFLII